jgi:hypothetical protein
MNKEIFHSEFVPYNSTCKTQCPNSNNDGVINTESITKKNYSYPNNKYYKGKIGYVYKNSFM